MGLTGGLPVIVLGVIVAVLGTWCAILEERRNAPPHECAALSPVLFDVYRSCSVAGATSAVVGIANLFLPAVAHDQIPAGVSWSFKVGVIFFLGLRLHAFYQPDCHAFRRNLVR